MVMCLFRDGPRLLLSCQRSPTGSECYCRPLGGGIEFGETSCEAIVREIREELGAEIEAPVLLGALENLFTLDGVEGHEIIFVYQARFVDGSLYLTDRVTGSEGAHGDQIIAEWRTVEDLQRSECRLVPVGLTRFL